KRMQFARRAIHFSLQGGIDRTLLLNPVLAAETFIDHLGRIMISVSCKIGNRDLRVGECDSDELFDFVSFHRHLKFLLSLLTDVGEGPISRKGGYRTHG